MKMKRNGRILMMVAAMFSLTGLVFSGEILDVEGSFDSGLKNGFPAGWSPNKPSCWDDAATIAWNQIPGTEKYSVQVTAATKAAHLHGNKKWPVATGDRCIVRARVKGKGFGQLGVYTYPGSGMIAKTFEATEEWMEFVAEVTIPMTNPEIQEICVVFVANADSSIEVSDVTAEIL